MNNRNKRNLVRLAQYLIELSYVDFSMHTYLDYEGYSLEFIEFDDKKHECGSVGCCIGHSVLVHGMEYEKVKGLSATWRGYSTNLFGFDELDSEYGNYLFSPDWVDEDNTPIGAAKRIIAVLTDSDRSDYLSLDVSMLPSIESYKD